jgi:hypothetical protein
MTVRVFGMGSATTKGHGVLLAIPFRAHFPKCLWIGRSDRRIKQWGHFPSRAHSKSAGKHLGLDQTRPKFPGLLFQGASTAEQLKDQEHEAHDESDVYESSGNVESKKSEQPKDDQDCCDCPKHNSISLLLRVRTRKSALTFGADVYFLELISQLPRPY